MHFRKDLNQKTKIRNLLCIVLAICLILPNFILTAFAAETKSSSTAVAKAPTSLKSSVTEGYVNLSWKTIYDNCNIEIYRSVGNKSNYELYDTVACSGKECTYTDYDVAAKKVYYYKIRIAGYMLEANDAEGTPATVDLDGVSSYKSFKRVKIKKSKLKITSVKSYYTKKIKVKWKKIKNVSGYEVYRSDSANGEYTLMKTYSGNYRSSHTFTDRDIVSGYEYYYLIKPYKYKGYKKVYTSCSAIKHTTAKLPKVELDSEVSANVGTNIITWESVDPAATYKLYGATEKKGTYVLLKEYLPTNKIAANKGDSSSSASAENTPVPFTFTHTGLTNGMPYYYKVVASKKVNGKTIKSTSSIFEKSCDFLAYKGETTKQKAQRIFGKDSYTGYTSSSEAKAHMTTFKIKVWDLKNGKKYTRTFNLTMNKNIAPTVKQMFKEIYESEEKIPIHSIGGYSWRGGRSEHNEGLAIDINPNENYMIDNGKILCGSFWNPEKSPYSIPLKCEMVSIMEKYGFTRGFWNNRKDYMHFSYFGT